ncbi:UbiA prenyltransferase family protein [Winogradskyella aquimaris]|uniref:Prenyltransferase n=1 Tax=Winogradskyella aquimaris TaxID=864074 RepID=A0ABU5ELZ9_9FLAO|nr:hypothetical protein [Winogradskyella aquimaris]MDY2587439.1 hypothetical protein [Winogradskyella aquimaris]
MRVLNQIFNFYINSSIHVALAVMAMTWVTFIKFQLNHDFVVLPFVFFATITGYNFVKYFGVAKFHHRSLATWLKTIQIFSFLAFLGTCYYALKLTIDSIIYLAIFGLVTFLYAIPLLPMQYFRDSQKNLRQIGGLKIYIIALVWAFTTAFLPLIEKGYPISGDVVITGIQYFIFVIVLMLPFEIRDLIYDNLKLGTIPQRIGVKNTKLIGAILLLFFFLLEFFKNEVKETALISNTIILSITLVFLVFAHKEQTKYYSAFWVESIPVVWLIILLMLG